MALKNRHIKKVLLTGQARKHAVHATQVERTGTSRRPGGSL